MVNAAPEEEKGHPDCWLHFPLTPVRNLQACVDSIPRLAGAQWVYHRQQLPAVAGSVKVQNFNTDQSVWYPPLKSSKNHKKHKNATSQSLSHLVLNLTCLLFRSSVGCVTTLLYSESG